MAFYVTLSVVLLVVSFFVWKKVHKNKKMEISRQELALRYQWAYLPKVSEKRAGQRVVFAFEGEAKRWRMEALFPSGQAQGHASSLTLWRAPVSEPHQMVVLQPALPAMAKKLGLGGAALYEKILKWTGDEDAGQMKNLKAYPLSGSLATLCDIYATDLQLGQKLVEGEGGSQLETFAEQWIERSAGASGPFVIIRGGYMEISVRKLLEQPEDIEWFINHALRTHNHWMAH